MDRAARAGNAMIAPWVQLRLGHSLALLGLDVDNGGPLFLLCHLQ